MRLAVTLLPLLLTTSPAGAQPVMTARELLALPQPEPDLTVSYGSAREQVGELRLPSGRGPHPVVVVVHGGCWQTPWGLDHVRSLCAALSGEGLATWSLEYRRLGNGGGGWPGTFDDVARGADELRRLAPIHDLDLERVVALGHSAGGHLALWLAGRHRLPADSPLASDSPLRLRGVVALAGIPDLAAGARQSVCGEAIPALLGGPPGQQPERVRAGSPAALLPLGTGQWLIAGSLDSIVPVALASDYASAARQAGDPVELTVLPGLGHFELVDPTSAAWPAVLGAVKALFDSRAP